MDTALLPVLTLLLGQLLGYWFAINHTKRSIAAEKRAEYGSRFIGLGYRNLRYLVTRDAPAEAGEDVAEFSVLGNQAAFFVSDQAAQAIDRLTSNFVRALNDRVDPDPQRRRAAFDNFKAELDAVRDLLRRDLKAAP